MIQIPNWTFPLLCSIILPEAPNTLMEAHVDDFDELNELLSDSIDKKKSDELKRRKEKCGAAAHFQSKAAQKEVKRIQKAEVKVDWKPIAAIAMFYEQVCSKCGSRHRHFQGYFQHQKYKWREDAFKYVPASDHTMLEGLPHFLKVVEQTSDSCANCIDKRDWLDENLYLTEHETPHVATWAPHKNYSKPAGSNENGWYRNDD